MADGQKDVAILYGDAETDDTAAIRAVAEHRPVVQASAIKALEARAVAAETARDAALAEAAALREALEAIRRCPSDARADWPEIVEWIDREAAAALSTPPSVALADLRARVRAESGEEAAAAMDRTLRHADAEAAAIRAMKRD